MGVFGLLGYRCAGAASSPVRLTILHVNDFHGHLLPFVEKTVRKEPVGGAACLAAMIREERVQNPDGTLLLSAGDMFRGAPISDLFRGEPVLQMMNELHFDAMAVGNHEFDWGLELLKHLSAAARFPFLSANVFVGERRSLPGALPYALFNKKGLKIAVIGLTTVETPFKTKPDNVKGLSFVDPVSVLPGVIAEVKARGARFILVLSHLGFDRDRELARRVSGIHVIVGGDSHTTVSEPVVVGETLIAQAGYYGIYLGVLKLEVDAETGRVARYPREKVLRLVQPAGKTVPSWPLIDKYARMVRTEFSRVVGRSSVDLIRSDFSETNIGDMVCDAVRESIYSEIAFTNGGAIRADIPAGDITMEQIYTMEPFDNIVIAMDLTGEQIVDILEESASGRHRIMQVSGLTVRYDASRPVGSRITSVSVGGKPLVRQQVYRVATNDFLAAGGDQYTTFLKGRRIVYGGPLRDVLLAYLKKYSPVGPRIEGRIVGADR